MPPHASAPPPAPLIGTDVPFAPFVAEGRVGRLATLDESGYPHLVPVCYATDGRAYYSAIDHKPKRTSPERLRRVENIRRNPRVALLIDHYEEDWRALRYVMVQGRAELVPEGEESRAARELLTAKYPQYRATPLADGSLVLKITPEHVIAWSATT